MIENGFTDWVYQICDPDDDMKVIGITSMASAYRLTSTNCKPHLRTSRSQNTTSSSNARPN
jgi:hypothetical protein